MRNWLAVVAAIAVAGCATLPEDVRPATVSADPYMAMGCDQLSAEKQRLALSVAQTSLAQQKTRTADNSGVFWLGMPLGSMGGGDHEAELATLKGQAVAVDQARTAKTCPVGY